jgi:hypothetical protein
MIAMSRADDRSDREDRFNRPRAGAHGARLLSRGLNSNSWRKNRGASTRSGSIRNTGADGGPDIV